MQVDKSLPGAVADIQLVEEQIAQSMVDEAAIGKLKGLGLVSLAAADDGCPRLGQPPGIPNLVGLGSVCVILKMLKSPDDLITCLRQPPDLGLHPVKIAGYSSRG